MKNKMIKPTDSELEILKKLWQNGASTVRFINEQLNKHKEVGYTTTLKLMQIMIDKKMLKRKKEGKSHIYEPLYKEEETQKYFMTKMLDTLFGGSAKKLVMQALGKAKPSAEEMQEIKKYLADLEQEQK